MGNFNDFLAQKQAEREAELKREADKRDSEARERQAQVDALSLRLREAYDPIMKEAITQLKSDHIEVDQHPTVSMNYKSGYPFVRFFQLRRTSGRQYVRNMSAIHGFRVLNDGSVEVVVEDKSNKIDVKKTFAPNSIGQGDVQEEIYSAIEEIA